MERFREKEKELKRKKYSQKTLLGSRRKKG